MSSDLKTLIVFDTNSLIVGKGEGQSYSSFEFNQTYDNIEQFIIENDLTDNVKLAIPRIVVEELKHRKFESFSSDRQSIKDRFAQFSGLAGSSLVMPEDSFDYSKYLDKLANIYLKTKRAIILKHPKNESFERIIHRALKKQKPFYKTNKHSDYGFKDVVIWESIFDYEDIKKIDKLILVTRDSSFDETCETEFRAKLDKYIFIFSHENQVFEELSKDYNINLAHIEYVRWAKGDYFRSALEDDIKKRKKLIIDNKDFDVVRYEIKNQCLSFEEEKDEYNESTGAYIITSVISIIFNDEMSEKEVEVLIKTLINDAREIEEIEYEPELI